MIKEKIALPEQLVVNQIYLIRGEKIMLDKDLAALYGVETRVLKQAVRRNLERFPTDFMFEITKEELDNVVSQIVIPNKRAFGGARPFAFTEQGIAMLSSVLNSVRAIQMNIQIIRVFTKLRQVLAETVEFRTQISEMKNILATHAKQHVNHSKNLEVVFQYLDEMISRKEQLPKQKKSIGFKFGSGKNKC